jgi:hypothetical protein
VGSDRLSRYDRIVCDAKSKHDGCQGQRRDDQRTDIMHDAVRALAQPLQSDDHGQSERNVQGKLGKTGIITVHVARVDEVAGFHEPEQYGQQECAGIDHARRRVVSPAAQKPGA